MSRHQLLRTADRASTLSVRQGPRFHGPSVARQRRGRRVPVPTELDNAVSPGSYHCVDLHGRKVRQRGELELAETRDRQRRLNEPVQEPFGMLQMLGNVFLERRLRSVQRDGDVVSHEAPRLGVPHASAETFLPNQQGQLR
jgi:hypothetical protein